MAGTARLADLYPGTEGSWPHGFTLHGNALYFAAHDAQAGNELWKTDGTAQGTTRVADVAPGTASPFDSLEQVAFISAPGALYFLADDGTHGVELWKTDGTPQGTVRLSNNTSTRHGFRELLGTWSQGALLFWSTDDELWRSTGTASGTGRLATLAKYLRSGVPQWRGAGVDLGGALFFTGTDGEFERLWRSDGTSGGTTAVGGDTTVLYTPTSYTRLGERLLFAAFDAGARALWSVDATGQALQRLASVDFVEEPYRTPVAAGGRVFFTQWNFDGDSLSMTDGTPGGTRLVKAFPPQFPEVHPRLLTAVGSRVFFARTAGWNRDELWMSDGTEAGTVRVKELYDATQPVTLHHMVAVNGRLYFWLSLPGTSPARKELWTSDGTEAGTRAVGPVASPSWKVPSLSNTAVVGGTLFFTVESEDGPPELWKCEGTTMVKIRTFGASATTPPPLRLTPFGSGLLFWADDGATGYQPWRTDGTEAGTVKVKDVRADGATAMGLTGFLRLGAKGPFVFAASDGASGLELWRTNGTAEGTVRVADIAPGVASSSPAWLVSSGQRIFFPAWHPTSGMELWAMSWTEEDAEPPTVTCPEAQVAEATSGAGAAVTYPPATATDGDGSPTVTYSHASGSGFALGATEVRATATDGAGNVATCRFTVTVRDTVAPALECLPAQSAVAESEAGVAVTWPEVQATDAVSTPTVTYAPERGSVFTPGTTEVEVTATDASGNRRTCTFEVRVTVGAEGGSDAGTPDGGSTDAGTSPPPPPEESSGCGCTQSGGAATWLLGLALLGLLSTQRAGPRGSAARAGRPVGGAHPRVSGWADAGRSSASGALREA
ncbi:HYR domain-containing protein [Pyxidicoccus xibeiensis]|uniref:HYR domain-containing protein n=1 Tax=Pyxidicoccus xibeiensis TaxID=2906759 RepID=UPI002B20933E|nr:HYR domain-containing protein [Pyxidicoccus xibeiensis]